MEERKEIVRKGYDSCVDRYYEDRDSLFDQDRFDEFLGGLPENGKLLDMGCGIGVPVIENLIAEGYDVLGIDVSREMVKEARKNFPGAAFVQGDMGSLPFKKGTFHGLTAFYSIIHLPREEHEELFDSIYEILKPNGRMLVSLGSTGWEGKNPDFLGAEMYWSHYSPEKTVDFIRSAGFEILDDYFTEDHWKGQKERHYWVLARKTNR